MYSVCFSNASSGIQGIEMTLAIQIDKYQLLDEINGATMRFTFAI